MRHKFKKAGIIFFAAAFAIFSISCEKVQEDGPFSDEYPFAGITPPSAGSGVYPDEEPSLSESTSSEISSENTSAGTSAETASYAEPETSVAETIQPDSPKPDFTYETTVSAAETSSDSETEAPAAQTVQYSETSVSVSAAVLEPPPAVSPAPQAAAFPAAYAPNSYYPLNYKEQKGIWVSYLEYDRILKNRTESQFAGYVGECFDNIKALGFNTVYVHLRPFGDAYYDSDLFPPGDRLGAGQAFDPLEIMLKSAHDRGLSVHGWINPMRLMDDARMNGLSSGYPIKNWRDDASRNGTHIVKVDGRWYLNPAYSEVIDLIAAGAAEIVSNYDIDGIQIDDYFYPTVDPGFDKAAYGLYGGGLSLSRWRMSNIDRLVKKLYSAVHSANPRAVFGISPQGFIDNNYNEAYADVKKWCSEAGYCDYMLPQLYFGFEHPTLPYHDLLSLWSSMTSEGHVKLVIGLAAYKSGAADAFAGMGKNEWIDNSDIISKQMEMARTAIRNYGGVALFRYDSLFNPSSSVKESVSDELENIRSLLD